MSKAVCTIEVHFKVELHGHVAVNREHPVNGHHYNFYDIHDVLTKNGRSPVREVTQVSTVTYYTYGGAKVTNA
jgi:hypothetical protein